MGNASYARGIYLAMVLYPASNDAEVRKPSRPTRFQEERSRPLVLLSKSECLQRFRETEIDDTLPCLPAGLDLLILQLDTGRPGNPQLPDGKVSWDEYFRARLNANWNCRSYDFVDGKVAGADKLDDKGNIRYCEEVYARHWERFSGLDVRGDGSISQAPYGGDDLNQDNRLTREDESLRRAGKYFKKKFSKKSIPYPRVKNKKGAWRYRKHQPTK